jgi:2'-5' RNA ligase
VTAEAGPPTGSARLFVAVWPPREIIEQLAALPRAEEPGVRWTPEANWHVTLRFLGTSRPDDIARRLDALELPPAAATLGPRVERLGRDGVVVPLTGLTDLAAAVTAATRDLGRPPEDRRFNGHVTVARLRRRGITCSLVGHPIAAAFVVAEVVLARSALSSGGARYEQLATWPLGR